MNQEISQLSQSKLQREKQQPRKVIKLITKNGKQYKESWFYCNYCQKGYKRQRKRTILHMQLKCDKKQNLEKEKENLQFHQQYIAHMKNQSQIISLNQIQNQHQTNHFQNKIQKEVEQLKIQISRITGRPGKTVCERRSLSKKVSQCVWQQVFKVIKSQMEFKLAHQIQNIMNSQTISIDVLQKTIISNLIDRFTNFPLKGLMTNWKSELTDSLSQVLSLLQKKTKQTISRNKTAAQFLCKFQEFDLTSSHKNFLQQLKEQTLYKRSSIVGLYNKLYRKFPHLQLKQLPINLCLYTFIKQRNIPNLQIIKAKILQKWGVDKVLATDMLFCLNFGLRRSELIRVFIKDQGNQYFSFVKILQRKNNNMTTRFISQSLIIMSVISGASYPLSQNRFKQVRLAFIKQIGQFYGIRHTSLTALTGQLLTLSNINIHKRSSMTINRYIDMQLLAKTSKIFQIQQFTAQKYHDSFTYSSRYCCFQQFNYKIVTINKVSVQIQVQEEEQQIQDAIYDAALSQTIDDSIYKSQEIDDDKKIQIKSNQFIFKTYHQQILPDEFNSQILVINSILENSNIQIRQIIDVKQKKSMPISYNNELKEIGQMLDIKVKCLQISFDKQSNEFIFQETLNYQPQIRTNFILDQSQSQQSSCQQQQIDSIYKSQNNINEDQSDQVLSKSIIKQKQINYLNFQQQKRSDKTIIVLKTEDKFQISEDLLNVKREISKFTLRNLRQPKPKQKIYMFQNSLIYCEKCIKVFLEGSYFQQKVKYECNKCHYKFQLDRIQNLEIFPKTECMFQIQNNTRSKENYKSIKSVNKKNNLKSETQKLFGVGSYSTEYYFGMDVPKRMKTNINLISKATCQELLYNSKNQQFLPLYIKKSQIKDAGKGMYSSTIIQPESIIISYKGIIKSNKSLRKNSDSLFFIGSIFPSCDQNAFQLFIEPFAKSNAGRFINSKKVNMNAEVRLGLIPINQHVAELYLYIISKRMISKDEEITYDYGQLYKLKNEKQIYQ